MSIVRPARRTLIAAGLGVLAAGAAAPTAFAAPAPSAPAATAPAPTPLRLDGPTGPERVGAVQLHLVDPARKDPWTGSGKPRELMATLHYPAHGTRGHAMLPWLSEGTARALKERYPGKLDGHAMPLTHSADAAPAARHGRRRPVLLYSPGFGSDRSFNTLVVEDLVSWGYIVVTVDHPHDSGEVEFPDGHVQTRTVFGANKEEVTKAVGVRAEDLRFVLDCLAVLDRGGNPDAERRRLPHGLRGTLDLGRVGAFGHSLGGASSAALMHQDRRVRAGIDLDGTLYGPVVTAGLDRPFLLMDTADHDGLKKDPAWTEFWKHLGGWHRCLRLADAQHLSFTDIVALAPQMKGGFPQVGTIPADRAVAAVRATVRAFFELHLRGRADAGHLLEGASRRYPEVGFIA
ncbi:lipase [Streptomyces sp. ET3-23]|uniref:alpha/beta hydrolase family protein n=1 Tax=Streptomyces sp. ET3-23 TaxID=2885643 RepID=UPI001D12D46A|nr:lipase [Streptomyces sp. ET3-23]MCC2277744.1 lipase [Streptomyces sp. ET3-23]